jgi:hypothetical protein
MRIPDATHRLIVLGRTGSGKTVGGVGILSKQNFDQQPWTIIDYKGDELIQKVQSSFPKYVKEIDVNKGPPDRPGLYVVRPLPDIDDEALEQYLWECWRKQRHGLFCDEGYMIPSTSSAMKAILTQGRSRRVPVIALYQRPVYMNRFAIAQADFFMVYDQNDERDLATTAQFIKPVILENGSRITVFSELPRHHFLWYDVGEGRSAVCRPAPAPDDILETFARRFHKPKQTNKGAFI